MNYETVLSQQAGSIAMRLAVLDYFAGERFEMSIAIAAIVVVALAAAWLFVSSRAGFALALMMTVVLFGSLMVAGLALLMIRDHTSSRVLRETLNSEHCASVIAVEKKRVDVVLSKFKYYRLGAAFLGILAIAGLMLSSRGWAHGIAAGLLLVVVAQVVIDRFSERRAHIYSAKLTTA